MEIAIISGKGGTGKSSISAAFATLSNRVVLADCDVDAANLFILFKPEIDEEQEFTGSQKAVINYNQCNHCGVCADYCRFDAISYEHGHVAISWVSCDGCRLCERICPSQAISMADNRGSRMYSGNFRNGKMVYGLLAPGEENSGKLVNLVRDKAKQISGQNNLRIIILDGPPGIGCPVISTITGVNHVVIVTEPTLSGLHDLRRTVDVLLKFHTKTWVIINKYDLNPDIAGQIEKYCNGVDLPVVCKLRFDPEVVEAMVQCKSIIEWKPDSQLSAEIRMAYEKITGATF